MSVVPTSRDELLAFYRQHQAVWEVVFADIGITLTQATALKDRIAEADIRVAEAESTRSAARTATTALNMAVADVRTYGASLMSLIRGYAENTGDPDVYNKAEIPPPAKPTPAGPPVPPTELTADPNAVGTITLRWKGSTANGQVFAIERAIDGGVFVNLGAFGAKAWTDEAVPMNSNMIQYRVFGQRGLIKSTTAATAVVNFGNLPAALAAAFRSSAGGAARKVA